MNFGWRISKRKQLNLLFTHKSIWLIYYPSLGKGLQTKERQSNGGKLIKYALEKPLKRLKSINLLFIVIKCWKHWESITLLYSLV